MESSPSSSTCHTYAHRKRGDFIRSIAAYPMRPAAMRASPPGGRPPLKRLPKTTNTIPSPLCKRPAVCNRLQNRAVFGPRKSCTWVGHPPRERVSAAHGTNGVSQKQGLLRGRLKPRIELAGFRKFGRCECRYSLRLERQSQLIVGLGVRGIERNRFAQLRGRFGISL